MVHTIKPTAIIGKSTWKEKGLGFPGGVIALNILKYSSKNIVGFNGVYTYFFHPSDTVIPDQLWKNLCKVKPPRPAFPGKSINSVSLI